MRKKLFTFLLALVAGIGSMWAQNPSGTCGENLTWEFNPATGVLTISGTGTTMTSIGWVSGVWNEQVTSVTFPESLTSIEVMSAFQGFGMSTITLPENLTVLGMAAFYQCGALTSIEIPAGVSTIQGVTFSQCSSLATVKLPASITSIYDYAFADCPALTSFYSYAETPPTCESNKVFWDQYEWKPLDLSAATLYVPYSSIAKYEAANGWNSFGTIAAIPGTEPASSDEHITANEDPKNTGVYYSTFFHSANKYALPENVEAYVAEVSSNALNLTKIAGEGQTIPADNAVILKSTVANFTLAVSDAAPVSFTATNNLHGVDADTEIASVVSGTCYVLSGNSTDGVGFFVYKAPNQLQAHKAYIDLNGSGMAQAPRRMPFVFETATGVENVQGNVQSTKVIENGVLYIIKNGVKYNAMGQEVK